MIGMNGDLKRDKICFDLFYFFFKNKTKLITLGLRRVTLFFLSPWFPFLSF
jgi:hypothetical protein